MKTMQKKRGFTLVELLVVIAILSLLAALLLPSIENSLSAARKLVCANNLRQMGTAINMYASEFHGFLPPPHTRVNTWYHPHYVGLQNFTTGSTMFSNALAPYTGFSNHREKGTILNCADTPSQQIYYWVGNYIAPYSYMGNIPTWGPKRISDVQSNKRRSILMADTNYTNKPIGGWYGMYNHGNIYDPAPAVYGQQKGVAFRPLGVNIVYIDGGVSWLEMNQINPNIKYARGDKVTMYWTE